MSFLWGGATRATSLTEVGVPSRSRRFGARATRKRSRHVSVVWAAARLRANLISTLPVDVFKNYPGTSVPTAMPKPPVLVTPYSWAPTHPVTISEWLFGTQWDLDTEGNAFGIITARDGGGRPAQILPVEASQVVVAHKDGVVEKFLIGDRAYAPQDVWHERQYVLPGHPVGLSPIAHAAWSLHKHIAAEEFALDWFTNGATPGAVLANKEKGIDPSQADIIKRRFLEATSAGEPAVLSGDWTYTPVSSNAKQAQFLEEIAASDHEILRFLDAPGDLVDLPTQGSSITYANITERHLQFLVLSLASAIKRREDALARLTPSDRFVKLNTDAFLRMDPATRNEEIRKNKEARLTTVTESRGLLNLSPLTPEQKAEIAEDLQLGDAPTRSNP